MMKRIARGIAANSYGQLVTIVVQLAGVPILLYAWGTQLYGEWLILFAVPAYLSMTDLGFSQSAANDMTAQVARDNRSEALAVFQSLGALVFSLSALGLLFVSILIYFLPIYRWFHFTVMSTLDVRWVLWCLCAEVLIRLSEGVNHAGYRSNGDYALHILITSTTALVQSVSIWIMALLGLGPVSAAFAWLFWRVFVTPASSLLMLARHRWLHFGFGKARFQELRRLFKPSFANLGLTLAQALNVQGMVLLVGLVLGPLAVVTFSTLRTMTRSVLQAIATLSRAYEPEFASIYGLADRNGLSQLFFIC